ncbi:MAG TPA: recombinase family protein [Candidatus Saccharimonadales bacterium]|nr:recombinase family protein [Candidatus Saccharimonadales bacterium]
MNNKINPNILLVARVSDVEQRKALPAQKKRLYDYATRKHWKENQDFIYVEFDETAYKPGRPTFNELVIKPLEENPNLNAVVFDKIDRYTRDSSSDEKIALTRLFRSGKIKMYFPYDNLKINKDSPAADLFRLDIGISLAAYYSASIRDNVKRSFDELHSRGVWTHRAPVGYKNIHIENPNNVSKPFKDIIVDEDRKHYIVKAFELRAQGMPYGVIAKHLLKMGYTSSKTGKAQLSKGGVEKIICGKNSKFYYGIMTHNGKEYKHKYPPLISRALYNQCQLVKDKRREMKTKWDSLDFTFSDIVSCGKCGRSVSPFRNRKWVYLHCANPLCKNATTAESLILGSVEAVMSKITIPEHLIEKVIDDLKTKHDDQQMYYAQSINKTRREYDEIDKKLANWFDRLVNETITPEQYDKIVNALTKRQEELNDQLDILTNGNKDFLVTSSYLLDLACRAEELFKCADEGQRSKLLGFLLSNIKLNDKKLTFDVNYPFNLMIEENKKGPEGPKSAHWCTVLYEVRTALLGYSTV